MSYPEGHLNVLAAPYFHVLVIAADLVEIVFRDGEKAASECGRPADKFSSENGFEPARLSFYGQALLDWVGFVFPPFLLVIWQTLPAERQAPVEVAPVVVLAVRGRLHELKSVQVDGGYVGTHDGGVVLGDPGQQRLQPPVKALACDGHATDDVSIQDPPHGHGQIKPRQGKGKQCGVKGRVQPRANCWAPTVSVEEGERVAGGNGGPQEPGGDEPLPLALADDPDNAEALQVLVQIVLQRL